MTDRELLELAAKAAGIPSRVVGARAGYYWCEEINAGHQDWNPLTDDGDALRLAVKLGITLDHTSDTVIADGYVSEDRGTPDDYAAARRAIVRAAAELGKGQP